MDVSTYGSQEKASDALQLQYRYLRWMEVLGMKLVSSLLTAKSSL